MPPTVGRPQTITCAAVRALQAGQKAIRGVFGLKHLYYAQEIYYLTALFFFQKKVVGGQSPVNDRRVGGRHNIVKQADSGLGSGRSGISRGNP